MSDGTRRLVANITAMLFVGVAQRTIGLVLITILSRAMDPKGLGAFTFVQSTSNTFAGISRLGADAGVHVVVASLKLPEERARAEAVLGEALTLFLLLSGGVACIMILLAEKIAAGLFAAPDLAPYVVVAAILLCGQVMTQFCFTIYAGVQAFFRYSQIMTLTALGSSALVTIGVLVAGPMGAALAFTTGQIVTLVSLLFGLRSEVSLRDVVVRPRWPSKEVRSLLAIGFPFYLSGLLIIPIDFICLSLLSRAAGVAGMGELRVTQALMSIAAIVPTALAGPVTSYLATRASTAGVEIVLTQLKVSWMLALVIVVGLVAIWPEVVGIVFGDAYPAARNSGMLALAAFVPTMLVTVMTSALLAFKRSLALLLVGALQAAVLMGAAIALVPRLGLGGFLVAQALGFTTAALALGLILIAHYGRSFCRAWMGLLTVASVAVAIGLWLLMAHHNPPLARAACAVFALPALLAFFAWTLTRDERTRLRKLAKKFMRALSFFPQ